MLPSSERLTRAGLFQRAYYARKSINTPLLTLYVLPRQDRGRAPARASNQSTNTSLASSPKLVELAKMQASSESSRLEPIEKSVQANQPGQQGQPGQAVQVSRSPLPLVGFVIAKKVCKSACARNRAKRRVREAYRLMRLSNATFNQTLAQWYALVFVLNNKILEADWAEVQKTVQDSLRKANDKYAKK